LRRGGTRDGNPYLPLHRPIFLPAILQRFRHPIAFLKQPNNYASHFSRSVIFLHDWLVLIHNHCNRLKQRGQCCDVIQRRRR
jgi:hypothetical protein